MGDNIMIHLFVKTYEKDYPWLKLAMTSVIKLCQEGVAWTIVGDVGSRSDIQKVVSQCTAYNVRIFEIQEHWNEVAHISGYLAQQWVKMNAHRVMGNDLFWNWDSDVIAIKPFSSKTFLGKTGKPIYWISQYNSIMGGTDRAAHEGRISLMREIFGLNSIPINYMRGLMPFEFMRCMPIPLFGGLLNSCAQSEEWQRSLKVLLSNDHRFSEFNVIGNAFQMLFPEAYEWKNAESEGPTWSCGYVEGGVGSGAFQEHGFVSQGWSWGGIPEHITKFVESL